MKKVKIMLLAIAILGATGSVLAFKATKKWSPGYCTVATTEPGKCPTDSQSCALAYSKLTDQEEEVCYTETIGGSCNGVTNCNNVSKMTDEGAGN